MTQEYKAQLIVDLLANRISIDDLRQLRQEVDADDLATIIQHIYDLNETYILKLSAVEGILRKLNTIKNQNRNEQFRRKIKKGWRDINDKSKKVVLAEGDSWFNYPVILTDIIDRIGMEKDLAVYSIAAGGDWLLNMLTGREYVEELSVLHPDVFLISGGGNDLVGARRLATILAPVGNLDEFHYCEWAQQLVANANTSFIPFHKHRFEAGVKHLAKDFYALLMFFHLQYYFLINGILTAGGGTPKFDDITIITQGYDYPIPSSKNEFGINIAKWYVPFIRMFLGHGSWLKTPLLIRGIRKEEVQKNILYAMIYLFNEMMIEIGVIFNKEMALGNRVFHIDSRDSVGSKGWTDELHPKPEHFLRTGKIFVECIRQTTSPDYAHVYVVKNHTAL